MFTIFRSAWDRRVIDHGRVPCPIRARDVEMDVCTNCRWLVELDESGAMPFVRCRPVSVFVHPHQTLI